MEVKGRLFIQKKKKKGKARGKCKNPDCSLFYFQPLHDSCPITAGAAQGGIPSSMLGILLGENGLSLWLMQWKGKPEETVVFNLLV